MSLLITTPRYDLVTFYFSDWTKSILKDAYDRRLKVFHLNEKKVIKKNIESYLEKRSPDIVIFNGHGSDDCIAGHNHEPLISAGINDYFLKGKYVYIRACSSGNILGPSCMRLGAKGFIGYKKPFVFWSNPDSRYNLLGDDWANPFMECSNVVASSLIKGYTPQEAHDISVKMYSKTISKMLTSRSSNLFILPELMANLKNQVAY